MSDILKSLEGIHKQLDDNKKTPDNNVSRDIIKSDASTFDKKANVKATLTSVEKSRTVNVSTVYWETYYKVKKRFEADTKGKTKVSTPAQKAKSMSQTGSAGDKKDKKGWSRLAIIAALIAAAWALGIWAAENLGPVGQFLLKLPSKLKGVSKIFKLIGKFLNMLSGGKLGKFFGKIGSFFMGMISKVGKIGKTVTGLFKGSKIVSILKGLVKGIGGKIAKFLRFLPFLGSVISFAFAYSKFKKGKYIGAMFELISGIANLIPGGQIVSLIIDGGILLYDLYESKKEKGKEVDGKKKPGFLGMLKDKIVAGFMATLPYMPLFGTIYHLKDAWTAFKGGDIKGALLSIGRGILVTMPGGGLLLKGLELLTSFLDGKKETEGPKISTGTNFLGMIKDKVVAGLKTTLRYLPMFGGLFYMGDAIACFKNGDLVGGLKNMALSMIGSIGGKGLVDGIMWVSDLIGTSAATLPKLTMPKFDFIKKVFTKVKDIVSGTIKAIWGWVKDTFGNLVKGVAKWIPEWVPGRDALMEKLEGSLSDDKTPASKTAKATVDEGNKIQLFHSKCLTDIIQQLRSNDLSTLSSARIASTNAHDIKRAVEGQTSLPPVVESLKEVGKKGLRSLFNMPEKTPEKAKVLKIDAVDKLTVRAINATSAGINDAITQSNAYLRQMVDLMKSGAGQGRQSAAAPTIVNSGGSDNSQLNDPPSMIDSRGSYFNSPYSMNVPPVA